MRRVVLLTALIFVFIPFLMGPQGCEEISFPTLPNLVNTDLVETEIVEVQATKIEFSYDEGKNLKKIVITHFHQGVKGKGTIYLTNEEGEVLQVLYQNLFYDLLNGIPNRTFIREGNPKKGDTVKIEVKFKCLNPFGGCLRPDDFSVLYMLGSGQKVVEQINP